ncbi:AraC-like DNA-binding protein [Microbacterium saperdae]|uniref:AraC-like DNA-binding protein n=1 Tax=Microbacterium saperdae TaxID=69368 RepID=A0A543BKM8_9MICO|nr:AraC-like DNA-binding protein [Microbacterium saperdae]
MERATSDAIRVTSTPPIRSSPPAIVLFRMLRGRLRATHDGYTFASGPGESVLFLTSGHYDFLMEEGELTQVRVALRLFAPAEIADIVAAIDIPLPPSTLTSTVWSAIDSLIDAPPSENPDTDTDQAIETLVAGLVAQVATQMVQARGRSANTSPLLGAALRHLDQNLADHHLSLDALAAAVGTSTRTLNREFRTIGTSPMAALRDARLTAVEQLLSSRAPLPPLDVIAKNHGYSDRTALTRAFHRRFGRSPTEHRQLALARSVGE